MTAKPTKNETSHTHMRSLASFLALPALRLVFADADFAARFACFANELYQRIRDDFPIGLTALDLV